MSQTFEDVFAIVVEKIRQTINEDWILEYEIEPDTRFNDDLEIESIEFVKIANAIQQHFGTQLNIAGWLAGKNMHELIGLSVGQLAEYVHDALETTGH